MLLRVVPLLLIAVTAGLVINYTNSKDKAVAQNTLPVTIPLAVIAVGFGVYYALNRQVSLWQSYVLTITDSLITREQKHTPTITILQADISEIIKKPNGSFMVKGGSARNTIIIPPQIDEYQKLEEILSKTNPISTKSKESFLEKWGHLLSIPITGLMLAVFISKDKIVVGISGVIFLLIFGYALLEIQKSNDLDSQTKKGLWVSLILVIAIIVVMYFKLIA